MKHFTIKFDEENISRAALMIQFSTATSIYFINVTINDPAVQQYLKVDTGSFFTWVHARESDLYHYNPDTSKTFRYMSCGDPLCSSDMRLFSCHRPKINRCGYTIEYVKMSGSSWVLGYD